LKLAAGIALKQPWLSSRKNLIRHPRNSRAVQVAVAVEIGEHRARGIEMGQASPPAP
jgi:hypothetical protein